MAKTLVRAKDPYRWNASQWRTKAEWSRWERVGMRPDLTLDDLWLDWVDKRVVDLEILGAVESIQFDRTIEGASTIAVTLRDPHNHLFNVWAGRSRARMLSKTKMVPVDDQWVPIATTDIIERAVDIILDGVHFRLVKVHVNWGLAQIQLTFEDRIIYWLRRKKGALKSSRAEVTRAMFVLRLLREIDRKTARIPFICPELRKPQSIAKSKAADVSTNDPDSEKGGFAKGQGLTVKGEKATAEQKRNMDTVLDEASQAKHGRQSPNKKALKAVVEAVIVESQVRNLNKGDKDSKGILQVRDSTAAPLHLNNRDIRACVRHFMEKGFWGKGGAIKIAKDNPHNNAGWVAQQTQGSGKPDAYGKWSEEADEWLKAWNGETDAGGGGSYVKSFQYTRDKDENSWDAMLRLAEEVKWRIFPVGNVMYFMSEDDLFKRNIRHLITPDSPEFIDFDADIDWGKPINEMEVQVNLDDWGAPPGCVVAFEGFGPVDGRWLVYSSSRDWFSPTATLTLHQPGNPAKEPAAERVTRSQKSDDDESLGKGKSADFYHYAKLVSKNTDHYVYGGGHGPALSSLTSSTNFDCSSSTSWALFKAGMWKASQSTALVSGDFANWGLPGRGEKITVWYNGGHVFSIFEEGAGVGHKRFDTGGPGGGGGARVRDKWRPTSGFNPRHWPGT